MMLTAIPTNPNPSVFSHNHTPPVASNSSPSQPASPDTDTQTPSSTHILHSMDSKGSTVPPSSTTSQGAVSAQHPTHVIPMTAVHQPFVLGAGGTGYTLVPSIQQISTSRGLDTPMLGLHPLSRPPGGTTMQPLATAAIPSGYYSRELAPVGFQPSVQPLTATSLSPPTQLTTGSPATPTSSAQLPPGPPQHGPPHTLLISGTGNSVIMNSSESAKPGLAMIHSQSELPKSSVLPPSSSQAHLQDGGSFSKPSPSPLVRTSSKSVPEGSETSVGGGERRRSHELATSYSISHANRQTPPFNSSASTPSGSNTDGKLKDVVIKREPLGGEETPAVPPSHHHTARRNSDSTLEESTTASSSSCSKSYQISALIDIPPMAPPLNRASRTSSLSSSLSSFRFGGSLSQLWASQISLASGKINNMKSTGNLNADAAVMPSLGNQYFAFGGSLPELSLTSLTRLLPNSSASDPSLSSCPGLFTLPLYVYPSQQHLATPFINTHGSITFGSFLSSGSSLCSTSKGPVGASASSNVSTSADTAHSPATSGSASISRAGGEEKVNGCGQVGNGSTSSLQQESVIKLPMYSPLSGALLSGAGAGDAAVTSVITSLPSFNTLTRGMESNSVGVSSSNPISSANLQVSSSSNSSSLNNSSQHLSPLGSCIVAPNTLQLHPHPRAPHPHHLPLHTPTHPHIHGNTPDHPEVADKHLPVAAHAPPLSPVQSYIGQDNAAMLQTVPISQIKMESDIDTLDLSPAHGLPIMSPEGAQIHSPGTHSNMELQGAGKMIKKEKDKPYKCDHPGCGRSFSFPAHLRSHIQQIHISYRPCKCEFPGCGKRFYTPQHLNVHRRVHTGERPFVCPYTECSKAFTTAGNLKNHIRTHTGERPYACKFEGCSKRFAEMSSLKKHELTHTGEKPYKCRVCGKAFSQAGSRNTHERKHNRASEEEGDIGGGAAGGANGRGGVTDGGKGSKKYRVKRVGLVEEPMQH